MIIKSEFAENDEVKEELFEDKEITELYQIGTEERGDERKSRDKDLVDKILERNIASSRQPSKTQMRKLIGNIERALGKKSSKALLNYLEKAEYIQVEIVDENESPCFFPETGILQIPKNKIVGSAFQHEVVHSILKIHLRENKDGNTKGTDSLISLLDEAIIEMEEKLNGNGKLHGPSGGSAGNVQVSEGMDGRDDGTHSETHGSATVSKTLSNGTSERSVHQTSDSKSVFGKSSEGHGVQSSELEGNGVRRTDSTTNQGGSGKNKIRNWDRGQYFSQERNAAKDIVDSVTDEDSYTVSIQKINSKALDSTIKDEGLNVHKKSIILANLYWVAKEIDKKMGDTKAVDTIYRTLDNKILEETLAYVMQADLAPVTTGALFVMDKKLLADRIEEIGNEMREYLSDIID